MRVPVIVASSVTRRAAAIEACLLLLLLLFLLLRLLRLLLRLLPLLLFFLKPREPSFYSSFFVNGHSLHEFPRVQIVVKLTVPAKVNVNFMYARGTSELTIQEFLCIDVNLGVFRFYMFPRVACFFK